MNRSPEYHTHPCAECRKEPPQPTPIFYRAGSLRQCRCDVNNEGAFVSCRHHTRRVIVLAHTKKESARGQVGAETEAESVV